MSVLMFSVGMEKPSRKFSLCLNVYVKSEFVDQSELSGLLHLMT